MDILKPFLLLACVAFAVGFMGFLGLAEMARLPAPPAQQTWRATVSAPLVTPDNPGKRI